MNKYKLWLFGLILSVFYFSFSLFGYFFVTNGNGIMEIYEAIFLFSLPFSSILLFWFLTYKKYNEN